MGSSRRLPRRGTAPWPGSPRCSPPECLVGSVPGCPQQWLLLQPRRGHAHSLAEAVTTHVHWDFSREEMMLSSVRRAQGHFTPQPAGKPPGQAPVPGAGPPPRARTPCSAPPSPTFPARPSRDRRSPSSGPRTCGPRGHSSGRSSARPGACSPCGVVPPWGTPLKGPPCPPIRLRAFRNWHRAPEVLPSQATEDHFQKLVFESPG
jgi:hypothetical protein